MVPSFFVIGAQKAGTTSLHHYLRAHPEVFVPAQKELDFFIEERAWGRGVGWYEAQFAAAAPYQRCGEIDPEYSAYPAFEGVPERIAGLCPDARLVYVLRHPIDRMKSAYLHAISNNTEYRSLSAALAHNLDLLTRSLYALQLEQYLLHFPREQILLVTTEDLREDRAGTVARIFEFIGVDPDVPIEGLERDHNRSDERSVPRLWVTLAARRPRLQASVGRARSRSPGWLQPVWWRAPSPRETTMASEVEEWLRRRLRPDLLRLRSHLAPSFDAWGLLDAG